MQCIEIERESNVNGHDFCDIMRTNGLLTKATKDYACRFTPSLVLTEDEVDEVKVIVEKSIYQLEELNHKKTLERDECK